MLPARPRHETFSRSTETFSERVAAKVACRNLCLIAPKAGINAGNFACRLWRGQRLCGFSMDVWRSAVPAIAIGAATEIGGGAPTGVEPTTSPAVRSAC